MKLKVCGMTDIEQLRQLNDMGVEFAGMIFYEKSARFVGEKLISFTRQIAQLPLKMVGVFVNASINEIKKAVEEYRLKYVQLHGDESPEFCREVQRFVPVIKAIRMGAATDLKKTLEKYNDACTYFLFDTDSKQYGGTGQQFNWEVLQQAEIKKPFFLSGGIGLEDAEKVRQFHHPQLFALDVNSRFETAPGIKDLEKVKQFMYFF